MKEQEINAGYYEQSYQAGYGLTYPDGHIIRIHKRILEWELHLKPGNVFDFGCGSGIHLKYFLDQGFTPYGCDTSNTAVERCKALMPKYNDHFYLTTPDNPDLLSLAKGKEFQLFISNQVLYFLPDKGIQDIVKQAYSMLRRGGVFVATMVSHESTYARYVVDRKGDFGVVDMSLPRITEKMCLNFKKQEELEPLFEPFRKLHIGYYGCSIREDEGPGHHWIFVGLRE